ncbi:phosphate ABC transporter substrate-binding protein [Tindallia californiensis]|uniref:Phosphate-binding protein n=1 Tax=Tindallia californiensis TaxID=159292 RepID=A0A1H3IWW6_9FIRM|nr:phosphate ABC transporter substrate-binding protein [Tindallia californiensis]SDY32243.1 phosphate ABC transporter substrate-binding protein, PhoT family [Tindallia californiensis]
MKKWMMMLLCIMMVTTVLTGCGGQEEPVNETNTNGNAAETAEDQENTVNYGEMIEVRGSDTMVNLGQGWAEAFMNKHPEAMVSVTGGGSGTGVAALINGTVQMAQVSRAISEDEIQQGLDNGIEIFEIVGARDGIALVVNNDNSVDTLTMEEIKGIYTGEITNWSQLGGDDVEIGLYSRDTSSGTYVFFRDFVLMGEDFSEDANLMPSTQAIVEGVIQDSGGIGYVGMGYLSEDTKTVNVMKDGTEYIPGEAGYPVARPLHLYTAGEPTGAMKEYVDFILSDEGQEVVANIGFIPLN